MVDCIFCKIVNKEIPAEIVYEDNLIVAFNDIAPAAPTHILIIPKQHFDSIHEMDDPKIASQLFLKIPEIAEKAGLEEYRVVINRGAEAGQTVFHLHVHIIGGRTLQWPPG